MKLGLGTAQFGLNYGISNPCGKTPLEEVRQILELAHRHHILTLDTAALYGESEAVLGLALPTQHSFEIVTKTPCFKQSKITKEDADELEKTFQRSLQHLRQICVSGLLIHSVEDLFTEGGEILWERMQRLKQQGKVRKIGVSVYTEAQIERVLNRFDIDIIQVPINLWDQRLVTSGCLQTLHQSAVEVHARSVFLQGLLLMRSQELPRYFQPIRPHFDHYQTCLSQQSLSPIVACLQFVKQLPEVSRILCGVNHPGHFVEILKAFYEMPELPPDFFSSFAIADPAFLDPSQWSVSSE